MDPRITLWLASYGGQDAVPNLIIVDSATARADLDAVESACPSARRHEWAEIAAACGRSHRLRYTEAERIQDPRSSAVIEAAEVASLLIIDGFGSNPTEPDELMGLLPIVRFRHGERLPIAVTTPFDEPSLTDVMSIEDEGLQLGARLVRTLFDGATIVS